MVATQSDSPTTPAESAPRASDADRLLGIYLADHRAGAAAGLARATRFAQANGATVLGDTARDVAEQIEADVRSLDEIIDRLGHRPSQWKIAAAKSVEWLGRLKFNGRLRDYSPLSRLLELELLIAGIQAKESLWQTLAVVAERRAELGRFDFEDLQRRALDQRMRLETHRATAARAALVV